MRDARADDWRRRLVTHEARWQTKLVRFSFQGISSLGAAEMSFSSPVTLLSGPNGVGKSTLLRALWATLDPIAAEASVLADRKLMAGSSSVDFISGERKVTVEVEYSFDELKVVNSSDLSVAYIDSGADAIRYQQEFSNFESAEDITNGYAGKEFGADLLAEINYILKRDYRNITIYEVELDKYVPFFEVSYGDDRYDSRTMGAGEISALHIWWHLTRAGDGSVVLIEEPEAFLSHACQKALANFIIATAGKKRICTVISSHAAAIIDSMPQTSLQFLSRGRGGLQLVGDQPHPILLRSVGIDPPLKAVVFVEDDAAREFCIALLERADPAFARQIVVDVRGGESEITAALRLTRIFRIPFKFIGLFDGDFREEIPEDLLDISVSLPGTVAIEKIFREMVGIHQNEVANKLGAQNLVAVLNGLEGADHHDWYESVAREVGLTKHQLFPILFGIWVGVDGNADKCQAVYQAIKEKLARNRR